MKVEILNPEVLIALNKNHGQFARVCYNSPEKHEEAIGKDCHENGHLSGSRCEYIKFKVTELDRGTSEQCLRHEIGNDVPIGYIDNYSFSDLSMMVTDVPQDQIVKNMASFRYIDKTGFKWAVPGEIKDHPRVLNTYESLMRVINATRAQMLAMLVEEGVDHKLANEAVNFTLPRATLSEFVVGMTPEALIHFMHKRLCSRAQEFIRELAIRMKHAVAQYNMEFAAELVPHCHYLLWCPEGKHSCGAVPTRKQLMERLGETK